MIKLFFSLLLSFLLVGCAPSKNKLAMMSNYDLCEMLYRLQNSLETYNMKYYWEELKSRNASCEPYAQQIRQNQAIQQGQMLNFFGAMGLATGIANSGQSTTNNTTNNVIVQPKPLPPVNITPPQTIPR